jgi:hypothetical protein
VHRIAKQKGARASARAPTTAKRHQAKTARRSVMPEQRKQNDDRQRHAEQPKQNSASHTHGSLLSKQLKPVGSLESVSQALSKNVEAHVWFPPPGCARCVPSDAADTSLRNPSREQSGRLCDYIMSSPPLRAY